MITRSRSVGSAESGKIMRRLLRDLAAGKDVSSDTSMLEDRSTD
jgi:hypothetical protein